MDTHLSRWQLSIEPQGQWRDRRKPLSSSFWLLLSPLRLLSLLAFNCTFLCVQNSQSSNTLVQDSSNLFTIGVPACPCFALSSALFPLSPFIHSDLFEFWAREQNPQQMIDSGLRGSKSLAPCLLDQNSERILQWYLFCAVEYLLNVLALCMSNHANLLSAGALRESIYGWPDWRIILTLKGVISTICGLWQFNQYVEIWATHSQSKNA